MRNLPNVRRERANARLSSTHVRAMRAACPARSQRSWLKLYITCLNPSPSFPTTFALGTFTPSNSMYVVPEGQTPMQSIFVTVIPGMDFSRSSMDRPLCAEPGGPVRTATVK